MSKDAWQLLIGVLALLDAMWLIRKAYRAKHFGILSAVFPRLFVGGIYLFDGLVSRSSMEPMNTILFIAWVVLFIVANTNHLIDYQRSNHGVDARNN